MRDLKQIAEDISGQDNRGTASPMLILLQVKEEYVAHDEYNHDCEEVFVEQVSGDNLRFKTEAEVLAWFNEDMMPEDHLKELEEGKHFDKFHMGYCWRTENVFFSDKGYEEHMAMNSHNYRKGAVRSYGIYAFRNPEMKTIYNEIMSKAKE